MPGGKSPKRKGNGGEQELVRLLKQQGIPVMRVPLSGAAEGFKHDLLLGQISAEVKRRKRGFSSIYSWLSGPDLLFFRADRQGWLVCMDMETFIDIWSGRKDKGAG